MKYLILNILLFATISLYSQLDGDTVNSTLKNDTCFVPFEEFKTECLCIPQNSYMIIDSDSLLKNIIMKNNIAYNYENYYPDNIDINSELLIGLSVRSSGCLSPEIRIYIFKMDSLKKIECKVNIIRKGGCAALKYRIVWIKFEKPPNGYSIDVVDSRNRNKLIQRKSCYE